MATLSSAAAQARARSPLAPYTHEPLLDSQIRLLELLPGPLEAPITARVSHAILEVDSRQRKRLTPYYEALSYVWGGPSSKYSIRILPDKHLKVRPNLYDALIRLRFEDRSR